MDVREAVRASLLEHNVPSKADRLICALSGGADSICLADVLASLAPELGFRLECAHFNHLLRGAESDRDESFVVEWCAKRGFTLYLERGDASAYASQHRMGIEEAARKLRYAFLENLADERTMIATAHQAEDQAETMLMDLLRGSGLKGLCGIPPVRGSFIRPLLEVERKDILAYLEFRSLDHVEDSSNQDTAFRRNRLRHEVMPLLRELNPAISDAFARNARLLRADEALLEEMAEKYVAAEAGRMVLSASELMSLPKPLSSRALRRAARSFDVSLEEKHISTLLSLASLKNPSAQLDLPDGLIACRQYDRLLVFRRTSPVIIRETILPYGAWMELSAVNMSVFWGNCDELLKIHGKFTTWFFKKEQICGNITARPRREGDHLCLPGRGGKSLKKWMIQEKIPASERDRIPVFADEAGVLAVWGLGADVRAAASAGAADSVLLILERT